MISRCIRAASAEDLGPQILALRAEGFRPSLAIVFGCVLHNFESVADAFGQFDIDVFGVSSAGEILAEGDGPCVFEDSIVATLMDIDRSAYRVKLLECGEKTSLECGNELGQWAALSFLDPAVIVAASNVHTDGEQVLSGILDAIGHDKPVFGGLAGDAHTFSETFVFTNGCTSTHAVIGLVFDRARVQIEGIAASGWQAVGAPRVVDLSVGNIVYTIDGVSAMQSYRDNLGVESQEGLVLSQYPLQIIKDGYSVLRSALGADPSTGALLYAGSVPQGSTVRFSAFPGYEVVEEAYAEITWLHELMPSAEAVLLFSCSGRHVALGELAEDEVRPLRALWNLPVAGLYTYGEIGRNSYGVCEFHNETCVVVAMREVGGD